MLGRKAMLRIHRGLQDIFVGRPELRGNVGLNTTSPRNCFVRTSVRPIRSHCISKRFQKRVLLP